MADKELEDLFAGEGEGNKERAARIFDENAPFAAAAIVDLVHNASSETVKLRAAQHVVDRVLGPLGKEEQEDALDKFLKGMEHLANDKGR
jgi:hypothetical protein